MDKKEFAFLLKQGEGLKLEFKENFHSDIISNYEDTLKFLYANLKTVYRIEGVGPREEILEIPEKALKECLINSMAHRDYNEKGANIQVNIFDDMVEISNPGGLIIKEEEFGKKSLSRNPMIFSLFQKLGLVEQVGSGIGRIKDEMKKAGLPAPRFAFTNFFTVTLMRPSTEQLGKIAGETRGKSSQKILVLIKQNPLITIEELADSLSLTDRAIKKNLAKLKETGQIKRVGPDKGGHWEIV